MEIEIKAVVQDKTTLKTKLTHLGATEEKQKHQIDEYYNHPQRDTRKTNEYLRLRFKPGENTGVFAYHVNIADGVTKEYETPIGDLDVFKQILKGLNFPLLGTIDKKRETFTLGEFSITLDEVGDIGNFIEIETAGEESQVAEKKEALAQMLEKLGIDRSKIRNDIWLCDIATGKSTFKQ